MSGHHRCHQNRYYFLSWKYEAKKSITHDFLCNGVANKTGTWDFVRLPSEQYIYNNDHSLRFSLVSQFHKPSTQFSFLKTTLYMFSGFIWPNFELPDLLVVFKWLVKPARFWWKKVVALGLLSPDFRMYSKQVLGGLLLRGTVLMLPSAEFPTWSSVPNDSEDS